MKHLEGVPITIKIRAEGGCFCRWHSPETNKMIDTIVQDCYTHNDEHFFDYYEHESGPEIIAWLALGTATLTVTKTLIDLVSAIINACRKGQEKGDDHKNKLVLIVRDTYRTENSTEEVVLEIYDKEIVTPDIVKAALNRGITKKSGRKRQ